MLEQMQRWRLILGQPRKSGFNAGRSADGCLLTGDLAAIDEALDVVYS